MELNLYSVKWGRWCNFISEQSCSFAYMYFRSDIYLVHSNVQPPSMKKCTKLKFDALLLCNPLLVSVFPFTANGSTVRIGTDLALMHFVHIMTSTDSFHFYGQNRKESLARVRRLWQWCQARCKVNCTELNKLLKTLLSCSKVGKHPVPRD